MTRKFRLMILLTFVFTLLATDSISAQKQNAVKWEYKEVSRQYIPEEDLDKLGEEGWELVLRNDYVFLFKRPKGLFSPKIPKPGATVVGQVPGAPKCDLTQAPSFRGIRLGMDVNDLLKLFPGSEEDPQIKTSLAFASNPAGFGQIRFELSAANYQLNKETRDIFTGVLRYAFLVLDNRLVSCSVFFLVPSELRFDNSSWKKKLIEEFKLPAIWETSGNWELRCTTFIIRALEQGFQLDQINFEETIQQRRQQDLERKQQAFKLNP